MPASRTLDRSAAKLQPESWFATPRDIVDEPLLTRGEKLATLERWRHSILSQISAADEGMRTYGYSAAQLKLFGEIEEAKAALRLQD